MRWIIWKAKNIEDFQDGNIIAYYGILNGIIIREATAMINPEIVQNSNGLVGKKYSSYLAEVNKAVPNIIQHDFTADKPNEKWTTIQYIVFA